MTHAKCLEIHLSHLTENQCGASTSLINDQRSVSDSVVNFWVEAGEAAAPKAAAHAAARRAASLRRTALRLAALRREAQHAMTFSPPTFVQAGSNGSLSSMHKANNNNNNNSGTSR